MTGTAAGPDTSLTSRPGLALLALAVGGFTIGTTEFATMGILTNIQEDLGISIPQAGHVITLYALGVVIGAPIITVLTARMPRKALLVTLMAVYSVGNVLSSAAPDLTMLLIGRFVTGLSHGVFFGVGAVVGTAVVGQARRGHAVSMMMTGLTVANVIGVPLSSWVGDSLGWREAYLFIGLLGIVTVSGVLFFVPRVSTLTGASPLREMKALRNGPLWGAMAAGSLGFGGMFAIYSYVKPMLLEETGVSVEVVPFALATFGIGMTVGSLLGGRLVDRDVRLAIWFGFSSVAVAMIITGFAMGSLPTILIGLFLVGVTSQVLAIGMQAILMDLSPSAPSLGASLCHSALNLANANGAFLGGIVISMGLGYPALAWTGVVLTIVGFVIMVFVAPHIARPSIPEEFRRDQAVA